MKYFNREFLDKILLFNLKPQMISVKNTLVIQVNNQYSNRIIIN